MEYRTGYRSPLGEILLSADGEALTGLWFAGQKAPAGLPETGRAETPVPALEAGVRWLERYFGGEEPDFTPPLRLRGSSFCREVWALLLTIPYGQTVSYGELAAELAARRGIPRMSAQAVGGALGRNPISLIVPCHRVIGADGSPVGYGGGLERKLALLELEKTGEIPAMIWKEAHR